MGGSQAPLWSFQGGVQRGEIEIPPLVVFLLFVTFSSFVNTKEEKVNPPRLSGGHPPPPIRRKPYTPPPPGRGVHPYSFFFSLSISRLTSSTLSPWVMSQSSRRAAISSSLAAMAAGMSPMRS